MDAEAQFDAWRARGRFVPVGDHHIFVVDVAARNDRGRDPLLILHGFPTCSYDWVHVLDAFNADRRVVLLDFLGFGLSDKPDERYSIRGQADVVVAVARALGLRSVALMTHDMGNSIGGEVLRRSMEGMLEFEITERILSNGSIYIDMAQLTAGQQMLLSLDDAPIDAIHADGWKGGVGLTFSPNSRVDPEELQALWLFTAHNDGQRMLPRTIRYIEDRRREERRYTGAIEEHPSPLRVVWGAEDPVAVLPMTNVLHKARPDARVVVLDGVGHYPMIEAPERFVAAALGD